MYESPWILIIVSAAVFVAVSLFRMFMPEKKAWHQLLIPVVIFASAFIVDLSVETDREAISSVISDTKEAVVTRDIELLKSVVSKDYRDPRNGTYNGLISVFERFFKSPFLRDLDLRGVEITHGKSKGSVSAAAFCKFDPQSEYSSYAGVVIVEGKANLEKQGGQWKIVNVDIDTVNNQDVSNLGF
ncbi:hypothetical protein [Sedimentisphaera salicampi]|uniref:SnoaL-like domain-containing protein n=1 Tax=Sedimentisphaera salicampi TaxID=1941349 RepID=A0A1W6LNK1_9BACT|nr:hypothetical protein [Sedimentisphaera salicampi]ARN57321.1 hypothetical protein STSP1_01725 [Sedimentisphaera salicampi]OXU14634.1 hypothetical protein SMSP1_01639 [Sedimentisphaera salicampi]